MLISKQSLVYSHCYPWDQEHQRHPELQRDHGYQGNQENQQYQQHPGGGKGIRTIPVEIAGGIRVTHGWDTYRSSLSTRRAIGSGGTLLKITQC